MRVCRSLLLLLVALLLSCTDQRAVNNSEQKMQPVTALSAPMLPAPKVRAGGELLAGRWSSQHLGQAQFLGIPFAAAPVGIGRFSPPAAHQPRSGLQQATDFGPACPQGQGNPGWYRMVAAGVQAVDTVIPELTGQSEDCLSLNIWTENLDSDQQLPVMLWIHGGSNRNGFSHEPNYLGHNVAAQGVIFVSINYRLGALGFMAHPALSAESPRAVSGNYGLLDQLAALRWVRDNIAAFGGDADAVTIVGESSGAGNSANLIATPLAQGLFRGAILQSGAMRMAQRPLLAEAEQQGLALAAALQLDSSSDVAAQLRALPAQQINDTQRRVIPAYNNVVEDGWVLPRSARKQLETGAHNPVALLVGSNAQEWLMYYPLESGELEYRAALAEYGGSRALPLRELLDATGLNAREKRDLLESGHGFHCPALKLATLIDSHGDSAFVYNFSRVRPGAQALMAYHGAEIPYAFDTADSWLPADVIDAQLTASMLGYWTNFVKTGDPNGAGLSNWPRFNPTTLAYLDLGDSAIAGTGLRREFCREMNAVWDEKLAALPISEHTANNPTDY